MILRFAGGGGSKGGNYPRLAFSQPGKYNRSLRCDKAPLRVPEDISYI